MPLFNLKNSKAWEDLNAKFTTGVFLAVNLLALLIEILIEILLLFLLSGDPYWPYFRDLFRLSVLQLFASCLAWSLVKLPFFTPSRIGAAHCERAH